MRSLTGTSMAGGRRAGDTGGGRGAQRVARAALYTCGTARIVMRWRAVMHTQVCACESSTRRSSIPAAAAARCAALQRWRARLLRRLRRRRRRRRSRRSRRSREGARRDWRSYTTAVCSWRARARAATNAQISGTGLVIEQSAVYLRSGEYTYSARGAPTPPPHPLKRRHASARLRIKTGSIINVCFSSVRHVPVARRSATAPPQHSERPAPHRLFPFRLV